MAVGHIGESLTIKARESSRLMLLGGKPIGERFIYWNFVSSSKDNLEKAKKAWANGPGSFESRFPKVIGDDHEYIPLPVEHKPPGTAL